MKLVIRVLAAALVALLLPCTAPAAENYSAQDINDFVVRISRETAGFLKQAGATEVGVVPFKNADDDAAYALSEVLTGAIIQELRGAHGELTVLPPPSEGSATFRITGTWKIDGDKVQVTTRIFKMPAGDIAISTLGTIPVQRVPKVYLGREIPAAKPIDKGTRVAVMDFVGFQRYPDYEYLGKAIPEAITTVFARNSGLILIERLQLDKVKAELDFAETKYTDPDAVVRLGKLLGASYVILGSYQKSGRKIRFSARRVKVETGEIFEAATVVGTEDQVFDLEDTLARNLLEDIQKYR